MCTTPFTNADRLNPLWGKLQSYWRARLVELRNKNDAADLDAQQTAALRGEIKQIKAFLAMDEEAPFVESVPMDTF